MRHGGVVGGRWMLVSLECRVVLFNFPFLYLFWKWWRDGVAEEDRLKEMG